jgi:hypothetical protein
MLTVEELHRKGKNIKADLTLRFVGIDQPIDVVAAFVDNLAFAGEVDAALGVADG